MYFFKKLNIATFPGKKKSRNFGLFAGNPAVFSAGFPLVLYFKAGNPANH